MKPASLALLLLVLAGGAVGWVAYLNATEESRIWNSLLELQGRDLQDDPVAAALFDRFSAKHPPNPGEDRPLPWRVLRVEADPAGERVLLLFLLGRPEIAPSNQLRMDVLDGGAGILWSGRIGTGYFEELSGAGVRDGLLALLSRSLPSMKPQLALTHFYDLSGTTPLLLRIEDQHRRFHRNEYACVPYGPPPEVDEAAILLRDLKAHRPLVLSRLALLGGHHPLPTDEPPDGWAPEARRRAKLMADARADPFVRARILELRKSADAWIREAAEAVPLDGSP